MVKRWDKFMVLCDNWWELRHHFNNLVRHARFKYGFDGFASYFGWRFWIFELVLQTELVELIWLFLLFEIVSHIDFCWNLLILCLHYDFFLNDVLYGLLSDFINHDNFFNFRLLHLLLSYFRDGQPKIVNCVNGCWLLILFLCNFLLFF